MKKLLMLAAMISVFVLPLSATAQTPDLIPPFHWTYHSLEVLSNKGLIDEKVAPGKSAYTPGQVVDMLITALNRVGSDTTKLGETELSSLRQLANGFRKDLEKKGHDYFKVRTQIENYASIAGLAQLPTQAAGKPGINASAKAAESINSFTFDIYKSLAEQDGNLFLSPYSISSALAMTYAGARGITEQEMASVLYLYPDIHKNMGALVSELNSIPKDIAVVNTANAIWPAKQERLLPEFVQTVRGGYAAGISPLNYKGNPDKAAKVINSWVDKHTQGKIKNIIPRGVLTKNTPMVLTNAVYFKSDWAEQFEPQKTYAMPFWISSSQSVPTMMMSRTGESIKYMKDDDLEAAELPYKNGRFSMVVLLPEKGKALAEVEKKLSADALSKITSAMESKRVKITMPKFKTEQSFELNKTLSKMGMPSAFNSSADFSAITGSRNITISNIIHKTFVEVGEEGTEAAAATAVIMAKTSLEPQIPAISFTADRPFISLIRDNKSKAVLFIGRYSTPK